MIGAEIDAELIDELGESCVNTTHGFSFNAVFDNSYEPEFGMAGSVPTLTTLASHNNQDGNAITVRGTSYTVRNLMPDGTGLMVITLEKY